MATNKIEALLKESIKNALVQGDLVEEYNTEDINIEIPKDTSHGDYSTNIAMQLTRLLHKNPRDIANSILATFDKESANVEKVEIAGPGFINFFMKNDALTSVIKDVLEKKEHYGDGAPNHIKYDVEFVSANPTGDLHLGHAKGAAVEFNKVLLVDAEGAVKIGSPYVEGAVVKATVLEDDVKADKVLVFKKIRRKGFQKCNGHRQKLSKIKIDAIA